METHDDVQNVAKWASGVAAAVYGVWCFASKLFRLSRRGDGVVTLGIGGTAPEIRLAVRITDLERLLADEHKENRSTTVRILKELEQQREVLNDHGRTLTKILMKAGGFHD
jgi:hypothetical protein